VNNNSDYEKVTTGVNRGKKEAIEANKRFL
jgi:hypothetical protein